MNAEFSVSTQRHPGVAGPWQMIGGSKKDSSLQSSANICSTLDGPETHTLQNSER